MVGSLAVAGVIAARQAHTLPFVSDDAWISFRYAWNLVHGGGLTWNPGLEPVEGYSNLLWTLWSALGIALGVPVGRWAVGWGIAFAFGAALCAGACARAGGAGRVAAFVAALLMAANPLMGRWMSLGLETPMFTFLLALGSWRGMVELAAAREGNPRIPLSGLAFGLACLCRAEGPFYLVIPLLFLMAHGRSLGRKALLGIVLAAAPVTVQLLLRLAVYGELVPNTARVKIGGNFMVEAMSGLRYVAAGLTYNPLLSLTVGLGVAGLLLGARRSLPLLAPGAACALFAVLAGGDQFSDLRFLLAAAPVTLAAAATGWTALVARAGRAAIPVMVVGAVLALAAGRAEVTINSVTVQRAAPEPRGIMPADGRPPVPMNQLKPPFAEVQRGPMWFLSDHKPPPSRLQEVHWFYAYLFESLKPGDAFLFQEVGLIGYGLVDSPLLDGRGLNWRLAADVIRAKMPEATPEERVAAREAYLAEFQALQPAIVFLQCSSAGFRGPSEELLLNSRYFLDNYRFVAWGPYFANNQICAFRREGAGRPSFQQTVERYARMERDAPDELDWARRHAEIRSNRALPIERIYGASAPPMVVSGF